MWQNMAVREATDDDRRWKDFFLNAG
jgi:hypothetical protein